MKNFLITIILVLVLFIIGTGYICYNKYHEKPLIDNTMELELEELMKEKQKELEELKEIKKEEYERYKKIELWREEISSYLD